jgi:hypothetical protein
VKYILTLSFSWFFVNILDFFLWGRGNVTSVVLSTFICVLDVKMILDILKEEEAENA